MVEALKAYIEEQHLFPDGQRVLLAVSGGRDSVCLAHLMSNAGYRFAVAHCNFHLRPDDCDRDQRFVQQMANSMEVPFFTTDFDTEAFAQAHGMSTEEAARSLRYQWFADLCRCQGFSCVVTAHHRDDSIETFFLNLFRGTGIAGLHGIRPVSMLRVGDYMLRVVHPMLCFARADIDAYMAEHGRPYVEDYTNSQLLARRNQVRHRLMPLLRELWPSVDRTMQGNMNRFFEAEQVYDGYIEDVCSRLLVPLAPQLVTTPCPMLALRLGDIPAPRRTILFEMLRRYGFNASVVDEMLSCEQDSGKMFYSASHVIVTAGGSLVVAPQCAPVEPVIEEACDVRSQAGNSILVDADRLLRPLSLRPWRDGDRFSPFGMNGTRLVSDFLKDRKVNRIEKQYVYVLTDAAGRIVWVVGLSLDNRFRIGNGTRRVLQLTVRMPDA